MIVYFQPIPPELQGVQDILHRRENLLRSSNGSDMSAKRNSHASDTSSAYSGSDVLQSSLEDQDIDFTGLVESLVDSDDEEGYIDNNEVGCVCICIYLILKSHNEENCEQLCFVKYIFAKYALW